MRKVVRFFVLSPSVAALVAIAARPDLWSAKSGRMVEWKPFPKAASHLTIVNE